MPFEFLVWLPAGVMGAALWLTLAAAALFSLSGSGWLGGTPRAAWILAIVALPVAGALLWFAVSHRHTAPAPAPLAPASTSIPTGNFSTTDQGQSTECSPRLP